jgi:hypothetical protein
MDLTRTAEALRRYDAAEDKTDALAEAVGIAYGLDTADRNDPETCRTCIRPGLPNPPGGDADLSFVRRMVRQFGENA